MTAKKPFFTKLTPELFLNKFVGSHAMGDIEMLPRLNYGDYLGKDQCAYHAVSGSTADYDIVIFTFEPVEPSSSILRISDFRADNIAGGFAYGGGGSPVAMCPEYIMIFGGIAGAEFS